MKKWVFIEGKIISGNELLNFYILEIYFQYPILRSSDKKAYIYI